MASSVVAIWNLALQKLGAGRVASEDEDSKQARACSACYETLRDAELRKHKWNFAKTRVTLAPSATEPDFDYDYAFPLPADCLRPLPPAVNGLDWQIETVGGQTCIVTNDGDTLEVVYLTRIEDTARFDPCFDDMLACKMAEHMCWDLTQSHALKGGIRQDYKDARAEARRMNAFESISDEPPEDPWVAARR